MTALVEAELRQCRNCSKRKELADFKKYGSGYHAYQCKACDQALRKPWVPGPHVRRVCPDCGVDRHYNDYGPGRWGKKQCCRVCKPLQKTISRDDLLYDYRFARDVLELSRSSALEWLAQGYGYETVEGVADALGAGEFEPWEPDPLVVAA